MADIELRLMGKFPKGDGNGLDALVSIMDGDRKRLRPALVLLDVKKFEENEDDGTRILWVRIRRIEAVRNPKNAKAARAVMEAEYGERTNGGTLPLDFAADLDAALEGLTVDAQPSTEK